jgi:hypothetical protein
MTVTSTALALGSWSLKLKPGTPRNILDSLQYLGHVAISTGRPDPRVSGDTLLSSARYVGVLRKITFAGEGPSLSGAGMNYWLGDENKKGPVITNQLLYTAQPFTTVVNDLLAQGQSVVAGTINAVAGSYTGYHQYVTIREALTFVCATMTNDVLNPTEFRVNGNGTLDAGTASQLYPAYTTPAAAIVRRGAGVDMGVRAFPGKASVDEDVTDYATRVILLGQGSGLGIASAEVHLDPSVVPYKDLFGNKVVIARTVSQSSTNAANSIVQAQLALDQYAKPRDAVTLSTDQFDIEGDLSVGDSVWVHDPDAGLIDTSVIPNELIFRGERINPVKLRINEMTWPVAAGMSVAYRDPDGNWLDLTDYVVFETGSTNVVVGGYDRSLTNPTGRQEALGDRGAPNTSIPDVPPFVTPFVQSVYQSQSSGITKAQVQVQWTIPLNVDGTSIIDGDHFEIRYRTSDHQIFPATWSQVSGKTWGQLSTQTWEQPIGYVPGPWQTVFAPFDSTSLLVAELTPGVPYDFQIRAVDIGVPPNYSSWSATSSIQTASDTIPPATPAAASVASSLIAVQVTHMLGKSSGGTFNLDADLHHLEVHAQYEPTFTPDSTTLLGKLVANQGMMTSQTPVIGTFAIASTANVYVKIVAVDDAGNASNPSTATQSSATLIDDSHITNLTVSKVTAGTISSNWLLGANIWTAATGVRTGMNASGFFAYDIANNQTFNVDAATGSVNIIGKFIASDPVNNPGDSITVWPSYSPAASYPTIVFESSGGSNGPSYINALGNAGVNSLGLNSGPSAATSPQNQTTLLLNPTFAELSYNSFTPTPALSRGGSLYIASDNARMRLYSSTAVKLAESYMTASTMQSNLYDSSGSLMAALTMDASNGLKYESLTSGARDGGFLWLGHDTNLCYIGRKTSTVDTFLQFASTGIMNITSTSDQIFTCGGNFSFNASNNGTYSFFGRMAVAGGTTPAAKFGNTSLSSGFGGQVYSYGVTVANAMSIHATLVDIGGFSGCWVSAASTTGFTVSYQNARAVTICWAVYGV